MDYFLIFLDFSTCNILQHVLPNMLFAGKKDSCRQFRPELVTVAVTTVTYSGVIKRNHRIPGAEYVRTVRFARTSSGVCFSRHIDFSTAFTFLAIATQVG